jgi:hypothetical protein
MLLEKVRNNRPAQLLIGFVIGIFFGFFLQKGHVTTYEAIFGQLLLKDFTVLKVMLTAIVSGMVGVYALRAIGLLSLNIKPGSWGTSGIGGLIFGVGLAILGYCPGTSAGAARRTGCSGRPCRRHWRDDRRRHDLYTYLSAGLQGDPQTG